MTNISKVEQFYNKNQFILKGEGVTTFQSYDSTIATIQNGELTLFSDWDYSNTTRKHLYLFLNNYGYQIKYNQKMAIYKALESTNKRQAIQKLIDTNIINYSTEY